MGYTHYWYRKAVIAPEVFKKISQDMKLLVEPLEQAKVELASWDGKGKPEFTDSIISFNGVEKCGHTQRDLGITWPAKEARGIGKHHRPSSDVGGAWFAGAELTTRTCGGDCSHESFVLEQTYKPYSEHDTPKGNGKYFAFCKTAYKPYDLAVTAALIIAKKYLGQDIVVKSDGESKDWQDARLLCKKLLGYGWDFKLDRDEE